MNAIKILATGHALPDTVLTNQQLSETVDTSDEWIVSRTGIKQRYISHHENTSDLAYRAAKDALAHYPIQPEKIRYLIVATFTPDDYTPSTACLTAQKLGLTHPDLMAFDLNAACSGFVYALRVMKGLLQPQEYGLIIGSEVISKLTDWQDRSTCILFGDGAGAVLVCGSDHSFFYDCLGSSGQEEVLYCYGRSFQDRKEGYLQMNGREVFKFAVEAMEKTITTLLNKSGYKLEEINHIVCHQANFRIISHVYKKMKADPKQFYINLDRYGNTSAASIPLALAEMNAKGLLQPHDKVICVGFGAGLTWGGVLFEW